MDRHEKSHPRRLSGFLEAVLDATDSGIMVIDKSGPVLFTNSRFKDIWGFPEVLPEKNENGRLLLKSILQQVEEPAGLPWNLKAPGCISSEVVTEIKLKDGRVFEVFAGPLRIDNLATGGIYQFRDVTGLRKAAEALREREASCPAAGDAALQLSGQEGNAYQAALENFERRLLIEALERNQWHRKKAARTLGLPLRTFYRKMKLLGLTRRK